MISNRSLFLGALVFATIGILTAVIFLTQPGFDLDVAALFADGTDGFALRHHAIPKFFNELINLLALLGALGFIAGWTLAHRMRMAIAGLWARQYAFLLTSLIVGPGLVANALFKENWGRARPRQITEFGGTAEFSPPLVMTDQCASNCSFVSGDASMGFFFVAVAMVAPKRYRKASLIAALLFGSFIGFMRIIQGAHFLSDVIFAGVFVGLSIILLYRLMLTPWTPPAGETPAPLSHQLGLGGKNVVQKPEGRSRLWMIFRAKPQDLNVKED
jgi:lipid A 4'-phosphatase